ncbi:ATP-dependent Clp protease adapter ClpS [Sulfurimonas sp. CVO]|jgi:ATP-dependent Clp protease adaptor protein ClpS|uniref:ATP-dependent Clp protease adapter protein ClpS n=1 Tax=Sulfurimonas xiamenensis TaxID=2590021 RepID=A0AAJ4A2L1_9BACT|nr:MULTISPECIES: ATP-dependent Clp protease adapter ClpS [Sulfurimonas]PLY14688.1 MAG: ATP-dependent Clp protease adapter ClpS [Sulfurimonas sp.]QFR42735.1 ATP-dependent Clp protease adapter ClpS [Sulfurimonas xiamenensis]QHG91674.1 ATP-dependent Clp protease adapter ClpS [Sulfurimonas sp. CVO]
MATNTDLEIINEISLKYPKKYKVLILNDDYTSMEFVVDVLINIFHKSYEEAENIMLEVHKKDKGVCGVYTHEIAETKIMQVHKKARENGFPLRAEMEEE